jgi:hypothetical protein
MMYHSAGCFPSSTKPSVCDLFKNLLAPCLLFCVHSGFLDIFVYCMCFIFNIAWGRRNACYSIYPPFITSTCTQKILFGQASEQETEDVLFQRCGWMNSQADNLGYDPRNKYQGIESYHGCERKMCWSGCST